MNLRTYGGAILIDGVKITSWNPSANTYDTDVSNGRSYILAKYDARLDVKNADLSYLGSSDGESYGVSWRDINDGEAPEVLRARVTGDVINSIVQLQLLRHLHLPGQQYDHSVTTSSTTTLAMASTRTTSRTTSRSRTTRHTPTATTALSSRAAATTLCSGAISPTTTTTVSATDERRAHGFMLDPGSPNSQFPQEPSHDNLLENNQAWGNDGYGLRVVGSINNTIQNNIFTNNYQGITLEQNSTGNKVLNNTITDSGIYGIYMLGGSDSATITGNTITGSGKHGIYFKTAKNTISKQHRDQQRHDCGWRPHRRGHRVLPGDHYRGRDGRSPAARLAGQPCDGRPRAGRLADPAQRDGWHDDYQEHHQRQRRRGHRA